MVQPPPDTTLHLIITGRGKATKSRTSQRTVIDLADSMVGIADFFTWQDGRSFLSLRRLMGDKVLAIHSSMVKWQQQIHSTENPDKLWRIIWVLHCSPKENASFGKWPIGSLLPTVGAFQTFLKWMQGSGVLAVIYRFMDVVHCLWNCHFVANL